LPVRTIGIMLLTCAVVGWVAMAPGAAARQLTDATGPTAGVQLAKPPALSPSVLAARESSALSQTLAQGAPAIDVTPPIPPGIASKPKNPKIDSHLVELSAVDETQRAARGVGVQAANLPALPNDLQSMVTSGLMRIDVSGSVQLYVDSQVDVTGSAEAVQAVSGVVQRQDAYSGIVQALVPISQLKNLAASPSVKLIRLPDYGVSNAGSVTTEGDSILKANLARADHGIDGTGVRVGIISGGDAGLSTSQASGDLPPVNSSCNSISGSGAEGTAMMEIVHDLAPGAQLWFASSATSLDFTAAVNCLAANTDVVVDDISYLGIGPYDGTSYVSVNTSSALNNGANPIRAYVTTAGNFADQHYQETFGPCASTSFQMFQATSATTDVGGFGPRCDDPVLVAPGATLVAFLQWNDPWGASCNNYDLYLYIHDSATILMSSTNPQSCSQTPTERITWTNPLASAVLVDLAIFNANGAAPRTLELFTAPGGAATLNFDTPGSSIPSQADAGGGVISVGAIDAADPGNLDIEAYSGRGPTNDGRTKPDITGIDDVSVTGDGGFGSPFIGTSAAAPHIAGIAALLLQCNPSLKAGELGDNPGADRTALRAGLLNHAVDLGSPGTDNVFGAGRADAQASANAVCPAWSASNFQWYADHSSNPSDPPACDLTKPIPPNNPFATGICAKFSLVIPDGNYSLRVVWKLGSTMLHDDTFPNAHLYSSDNWQDSLRSITSGGTYSITLYANGTLLGSASVTVQGPPTPTPTLSPTPTPTHSPTPTPSSSATPTPSSSATPTHSPTPTPRGPIWGDLNCDGVIGPADAMLGLEFAAGLRSSLPCGASADVDCNGVANGLDVLDLLRFISHLPSLVTGNCAAIGSG
jgi:hypothetical protein